MPRVTRAFSDCPQPPSTVRPGSFCLASRTMARGIGAPMQQNKLRQGDHESDLTVAVDRDQRVVDRPDAGDREVDDEELDPVGQLETDDVPGAYAQLQQPESRPVGEPLELAVGDLPAGVDRGELVRGRGGDLVEEVGDDAAGPESLGGVLLDPLGGGDGLESNGRPRQLIVRPPLTLTVWPVM